MKRNWDKLHKVLQAVENDNLLETVRILEDSCSEKEVDEYLDHIFIALLSHLIEGIALWSREDGHCKWIPDRPRLTMQGHDLLKLMNCTTFWKRVQKTSIEKAVPITQDLIKHTLSEVLEER